MVLAYSVMMKSDYSTPPYSAISHRRVPAPKIFLIYLLQILTGNCSDLLYGQTDSLAEIISEAIPDQNELDDLIEEYAGKPLHINSATRAELEFFSFLSPAQVDSILESRPFKHKNDLREILGRQIYTLFAPFFTVAREIPSFHSMAVVRYQLLLARSKGFREHKYRGSPGSVYTRIQFQYRPMLSGGLLTQKDAGESSFYDHYTGFLQWQDRQSRYKLILGSYQLQLAQGLAFASPFGNGKGMFPMLFSPSAGMKLTPYLSSNEGNGFLGIAGQINDFHHAQLTLFLSNNSRDASLVDGQINKIATSGYHRSRAEIAGMNRIRETSLGIGGSVYSLPAIAIGASMFVTRYKTLSDSPASLTGGSFADSVKDFPPDQINGFSFYGHSSFIGLNTAVELATNDFQNFSQQFVLTYILQDTEVGVKWWYIQKNYLSPFGKSFASNSSFPQAKNGCYLAASSALQSNVSLSGYWTIEKDLWRTFFNPMPQAVKEFCLQVNLQADPLTLLTCKYRFNERRRFTTDSQQTYIDDLYQFRLQLEKSFSPSIRIRCRWEKMLLSRVHPLQGINVYQDLDYQLSSTINLTVRFSSFKLDDYLVHTYEYENDLPGVFSSSSLYGKGNKWYLLIKYRITDHLLCWFKYRRLYLDGVKSIGNGDEQINGDNKQEIRIQLNWEY
jgi:hypothetical protein